MNTKYELKTNKTFDEAVESVVNALSELKFGVLWKLNFKDKLKEKGVDFDHNYIIMEVCNPHKAKEVLTQHLDVGYFLPCKVVVYESDEGIKMGFISPKKLIGMLGYDDLDHVSQEVEDTLKEAIDKAAK